LGLLDAHEAGSTSFQELLIDPDAALRRVDFPTEGSGFLLVIGSVASLKRWPEAKQSESERCQYEYFKANELYVRTLIAYNLARYIPLQASSHDADRELKSVALNLAVRQPHGSIWEQLRKLRDDIVAVRAVAEGAVERGVPEIDSMMASKSTRGFLSTLAALYQLGRRPHDEAEKHVENEVPWLRAHGGSYKLRKRIRGETARRDIAGQLNDDTASPGDEVQPEGTSTGNLATLLIVLRNYQILRDLARAVAGGAAHWAANAGTLKALIIDEDVAEQPDGSLAESLRSITRVFRQGTLALECAVTHDWQALKAGLLARDSLIVHSIHDKARAEIERSVFDYDLIILEVESKRASLGPSVVQWLSSYFDSRTSVGRPRVLVLSSADHVGHIQQCLNHGAEAYVLKQRIYSLPARMAQTRVLRTPQEPRGRKSNFRSLYQLLPREIASLQSTEDDDVIWGNAWDDLEREWIRSLPKADLHTHIGTCIDLGTVRALAFNTCGYVFGSEDESLKHLHEEVVAPICEIVLLMGMLEQGRGARTQPRSSLDTFLAAAELVLAKQATGRPPLVKPSDLIRESVYDTVIRALTLPHRQIASFEVCALLVMVIETAAAEAGRPFADGTAQASGDPWIYFDELCQDPPDARRARLFRDVKRRVLLLCKRITAETWHRGVTIKDCRRNFAAELGPATTDDELDAAFRTCSVHVRARSEKARLHARSGLKAAAERLGTCGWVSDFLEQAHGSEAASSVVALLRSREVAKALQTPAFAQPSLDYLVRNPPELEHSGHTLRRYLAGAGLLGAEHLQYPENLILGAKSVVEQAIRDNAVYTELRCATTGYTAGGMMAPDATDLLCISLDLASSFYALVRRETWVRCNILLGAKRHKSKDEFRAVTSLLAYYLQRGVSAESHDDAVCPAWWKPTRVVGFDLSGEERDDPGKFPKLMRQLFTYCAPITIHAGEAATAESIWYAVYRLGARRIGHGLRLRENNLLLNYCITEGLCMEMCPISNSYTNHFVAAGRRDSYDGLSRESYPLKYYLDQGLDVCINTDNRHLHWDSTLTDEYLFAARLVGGLSKWEVLKLVKAGFKNAFLPKHEIERLLQEIEYRVYVVATE